MMESLSADYAQSAASVTTVRIELDALPRLDATAIVRNTLGAEDIPDVVAGFVTERSGGNPFFTQQLALALRDRGYLVVEKGRVRLGSGIVNLAEAEVPDSVERVVTGRIDLLSAQQQLTVKVASVIGRLFSYRALHDVHPVPSDRPALPAQLDDMESRDLIREHAPEPDLAYLFKHAVLQEVAYNLLAFGQRQQLHRGVAEWLETRHGGDLDSLVPLLAHHWVNAGDRGKAIGYLERAGKQSLDQFANVEAIRFLEQAMRFDADDAPGVDDQQRSRWEWWIGVAYLKLSDYDECARHQNRGLALLGFHVPTGRIGLVLTLLGQIARQVMHRLHPESLAGSTPAARARFHQASEMYQYRSEYGFFNTDALWALHATMYNLNCAERAGDPTEVAEACAALGVIAGIAGLHPLARYYSNRALAVAEAIGQRSTQAFVHQLIAVYRHALGHWDLVAHHIRRAIELFGEVGDRFRWEGCHAIEVMLHLHRCDIGALEEISTRLHASAYPNSTAQILAWCQGGRLAAAILRDSIDETIIADLEAALDAHLPHGDRIWGYGLLAWAHHRLGQEDRAVRSARRALEIARRHPPGTYYVLRALGATAEVLLDHWQSRSTPEVDDSGRRHREARAAVKALRAFARLVPVAVPAHWLHRGRLLAAEGRSRRAIGAWRRSLAAAEGLELPWDLAHAALELARAEGLPPAARAGYGNRAAAVFESLGDPAGLRNSSAVKARLA
jgi:tetratricopeptide (TPR) repeat protein